MKGSSARFDCQVTGTPPFEITWHKDAKEIKPSAKHGFSQMNDTVGLEVHKCDPADVGEYQCTVANEVGSCACKAVLLFKGQSYQNYKNIHIVQDSAPVHVSLVSSNRTTNIYKESGEHCHRAGGSGNV